MARVEIDIFSGRPNPSWELSSSDSFELTRLIGELKPTTTGPPPDGLGFRGFNIHVTQQGQPMVYHVTGSLVTGGERGFVDSGGAVERFLLSRVPSELRKQLGAALPP